MLLLVNRKWFLKIVLGAGGYVQREYENCFWLKIISTGEREERSNSSACGIDKHGCRITEGVHCLVGIK